MSVMSLAIPEHMADVLDEWGAISLILEKIILGASDSTFSCGNLFNRDTQSCG